MIKIVKAKKYAAKIKLPELVKIKSGASIVGGTIVDLLAWT